MAFTLTDDQIDTLSDYGVEEGGYLPNTSKRLAPDGTFVGGKTDYNPTYSSPAPTDFTSQASPTGLDQNLPTIDSTLGAGGNLQYSNYDPYQADREALGAQSRESAFQDIDPNQLYRDQLRQYQTEIDAVNNLYRQKLNVAQQEGLGRLGSGTALQARSGLVGSDFGQAQTEKIRGYNTDIRSGIQAEQSAKVGAILGLVRKGAADELAAKVTAKQAGAESYLAYLNDAGSRRNATIQNIAQAMYEQGLDPDDTSNLNEILKDSNVDEDSIRDAYTKYSKEAEAAQATADAKKRETDLKTQKTEAEIRKIDADIAEGKLIKLGEGDMYMDLTTGKMIKNPKTLAPGSGTKSSYPVSAEAVDDLHTQMQSKRGSDGFVDSEFYMRSLSAWETQGGEVNDFLKEYPLEEHVNPNDPTVNSMIQGLMEESVDPMDALLQQALSTPALPTGRNTTSE